MKTQSVTAITIISGRGSVGTMYSTPCTGMVVSDGAGPPSKWAEFWEIHYSRSELQDEASALGL